MSFYHLFRPTTCYHRLPYQWGCWNLLNWSGQAYTQPVTFLMAAVSVPHLYLYLLKLEWLVGIVLLVRSASSQHYCLQGLYDIVSFDPCNTAEKI